MSSDPFRFMGLTKTQYLGVLLAIVVALSAMDAYLFTQSAQLATDGAQSHEVLCVLKTDYARRRDESAKFLKLTPSQRAKKYGDAFGRIPDSVLQQSLRNLDANLKAMQGLECDK